MRANTVHQYSKIFHSSATNYTILIGNHDKHILCQNISDKKVIELLHHLYRKVAEKKSWVLSI